MSTPRTVAIYGGSFNPPHLAHAMVATTLRLSGLCDALWLLPVYRHAFEATQRKRLAPFERRVGWCRDLAAAIGAWVEVSAIEAVLPQPSYTIQTLRALAAAQPALRLRLVVGADVLGETAAWRAWDEIEAEFSPIVIGRQGVDHPLPRPMLALPAVSSSEVRARLRAGEAVDHLVPAVVLEDLRQRGLPLEWEEEGRRPAPGAQSSGK